MKNEPQLVWEKWENIYEDPEEPIDEIVEYEDDPEEQIPQQKILVFSQIDNEADQAADLSKIFNFWVCHSNFNIDDKCVDIVESCEGVETLEIITRYRFRISIGRIFDDGEVMRSINKKLLEYINEKNR